MGKLLFFGLMVLHGLIHLIGFIKAFGLAHMDVITKEITKPQGLLGLLSSVLFVFTGILFLRKNKHWWIIGLVAVLLSQALILQTWQDSKFGTLANAVLLLVILFGFASWNFAHQVNKEMAQLLQSNTESTQPIIKEQLLLLPEPICRWIKNSGVLDHNPISQVHLRQKGQLRLKPEQEKWMNSEAEQMFTISEPTFLWQVKTSMNGLPVLGRDLFQNGQGSMKILLGGLIPVVNVVNNEKVNQSTLQRYLGETVWFPSGALSPYITWEEVDENSAKATMSYGGTTGSANFYFDENGDLTHFIAYRFKETTDEKPTPWMAKVLETRTIDGIRIPVKLEASWILEEGTFTWYRFEIFDVEYR